LRRGYFPVGNQLDCMYALPCRQVQS
jgi:hypothetical protein